MKFCPNCKKMYDDYTNVCTDCGTPLMLLQSPAQADPTDHTAEFDPADVSQNKVLAMAPYLMSFFGIIIALLASSSSPYVSFHVKQAMKIQIVTILSCFLAIIPVLGWIAIGVWSIIAFVLVIMGFVQVCKGQAKDIPIVSGMSFLK